MISSVGSNYLTALYATQQASAASALASTTASSSVSSTAALTGDQANISGPGQLLGQLLALQSNDPAKFKQVAADISSALQAAATMQTNDPTAAQFLSGLADQFQTVSTTGDLSSLLPPKHGHHHHHAATAQGTYNQFGQAAPVQTDPTATSGTDLTKLFQSLITQVTQAIAA